MPRLDQLDLERVLVDTVWQDGHWVDLVLARLDLLHPLADDLLSGHAERYNFLLRPNLLLISFFHCRPILLMVHHRVVLLSMNDFPLLGHVLIQVNCCNLISVYKDLAMVLRNNLGCLRVIHTALSFFNIILLFNWSLLRLCLHHRHLRGLTLRDVLAALDLAHKLVYFLRYPLRFETMCLVVEPGLVRVLRSEVLVTVVLLDTVKERFEFYVFSIHFLHEIIAILHSVSIWSAKLLVLDGITLTKLLQEVLFVQVDHFNTLCTDYTSLKNSLLPALHHLLVAELATMAQLSNDTLYDKV